MLNSQIIERKVEGFLKTFLTSNKSENRRKIQIKKFELLSKLIVDLFNCKNSRECFNNISSLIILILNIYNEKFPVDIYFNNSIDSQKKTNSKFKNIMKEEFLID